MNRTLPYLLLLAIVAVTASVLLVAVVGTGAAPDETAASERAAAASTALAALRGAELEGDREWLAATARRPAFQRLVNPALATHSAPPAIDPTRPPERDADLVAPSMSELLDDARGVLQAEVEARGADVLAVFEVGETNKVLASSITETDLGRVLSQKIRAELDPSPQSGVIWGSSGAYDVSIAPINEAGTHWLLLGSKLDESSVARYSQALGAGHHAVLVRKGEPVTGSSLDAAVRGLINERARALRSKESLNKPGADAIAPQAVDGVLVSFGVVPATSLSGGGQATGFMVVTVEPIPDAGGLSAITSSSLFTNPGAHLPLIGGGAAALLVLIVLGVFLTRSAGGSLKPATQKVLTASSIETAGLSSDQQEFAAAVLELAPKTASPSGTDTEALKALREELQEEVELQGSRISQLQKQLEYARGEVSRTQKESRNAQSALEESHAELVAAQDAVEHLEERIRELESEKVVELPPPAAEVLRPDTEDGIKPMDADDLPAKEYDTAEVSGEEMSQLLEEIDRSEIHTEEIPGEDLQSIDSLSEMADRLVEMSDSQVRKLSEGTAPTMAPSRSKVTEQTVPRARMPEPPGGQEDEDEKKTSQHWKVPSKSDTDNASVSREQTGKQPLKAGRTTLPGGLRVPKDEDGKGETESAPNHAVAPPPWQKGAQPAKSLSPASLLEALKKRGQGDSDSGGAAPQAGDSTRVSRTSGLLKPAEKDEKPSTLSQSGLFSRTGSRVGNDPSNDTEYFKSLYEEFVETKRRCGESVEKITLERFVNRLAKNKKSLMDRYNCRTVRFQVYVKDGRAALKATPVK